MRLNLLFTLLVSALVFSVSGCGKKSPPPAQSAVQNQPSAQPPPKKVAVQVEDKEEGTPFTQIKVQNWDASKEARKVEEEGDNIKVKDAPTGSEGVKQSESDTNRNVKKTLAGAIKKTPSKCFAARLLAGQDSSKLIEWQPKWHQKGIGGAWIPAAVLSDDRSVLVVIETTGKDEGPFGSRIICINTYDWKIISILDFENKYFTEMAFAPDSDTLICLAGKQPVMKQPSAFNALDLITGTVKEGQPLNSSPVCWKALSRSKIYASFRDSESLMEFNISEIGISAPLKTSLEISADSMAISQDKKNMALASKSVIKYVSLKDLRVFHSVDLKNDLSVKCMEFGGSAFLAAVLSDGSSVYMKNGAIPEDFHTAEGIPLLSYYSTNNTFIVGDNYMAQLHIFDCDRPAETLSKPSPASVKPMTSSFLTFAAYLPGTQYVLVIDKPGNIYRIWAEGKRYGKEILFTGMDSLRKK